MERSALCRSRQELSNEYLLAKIGVDTAENEPLEVWGKIIQYYSFVSLGVILTGLGYNWIAMVAARPILMPILGFALGSFGLFPGLPLGPLYSKLHYWAHRKWHFNNE